MRPSERGGRRESGAKSVPWYGPQNSYCFYVFSAAFKLLLLAHFLAGSARAAAWGWRGGEGGCCSGQGAASEIAKLNKNVTQCLAGCPPRFLFLCLCILFVSFRSVFFFPFFVAFEFATNVLAYLNLNYAELRMFALSSVPPSPRLRYAELD